MSQNVFFPKFHMNSSCLHYIILAPTVYMCDTKGWTAGPSGYCVPWEQDGIELQTLSLMLMSC